MVQANSETLSRSNITIGGNNYLSANSKVLLIKVMCNYREIIFLFPAIRQSKVAFDSANLIPKEKSAVFHLNSLNISGFLSAIIISVRDVTIGSFEVNGR